MASIKFLIIAVVCLSPWVSIGESVVQKLELATNYTLSYEVLGNSTNGAIEFVIEAKAKGWVALGFNPDKESMFNTDFFMGYFANPLLFVYGDFFLRSNSTNRRPILDPQNLQNWKILNGTQTIASNGTVTTKIAISRNLITNDTDNDHPITNKQIYLLWAYHTNITDMTVGHTERGWRKVNLLSGSAGLSVGISTILTALVASIMKSR